MDRLAPQAALLQHAVDEAARLLRADGALIALLDDDGDVRLAYWAGIDERQKRSWIAALRDAEGRGLIQQALEQRRIRVTDDYLADDSFVHPRDARRSIERLGLRSFVVAPLVGSNGAIGALGAFSTRPAAFDEAEVALVRALADHAAGEVDNARLIDQLDRSRRSLAQRAERERVLREITSNLVAIRDPGDLLQRVVEDASRLVHADGAILALLDADRTELSWSYDDGLASLFDPDYVANLTLPAGVGVTGQAVVEGHPVVAGEDLINRFPRSPESDTFFEVSGFRSMIAAPIVGEDGPLGALEVYSREEHAFADEDTSLIETLAGHAAVTLTNARLIEELRRSRERLARRAEAEVSLREIAGRISAIRDPDAVLQHTLDEAVRLLGSDGGRIALIDEKSGDLAWAYASGDPPLVEADLGGGHIVRRDGGISGRAIADRHAFFTADYLADERFEHGGAADEFVRRSGIRAAIAAPIVSKAGPLGAINVHAYRPGVYDETAAELLDALASQAAIAVSNARLIRELRTSRSIITRRAEAETALREIGARLTAVHDPGELLQLVALEASRLLSADRTQIDLLDPQTGMLNWAHVVGGDANIVDAPLDPSSGAAGRAIMDRRPFVTGDYLLDDRFVHSPGADEFVRRTGLRSIVAAPLFNEAQVLGALNVGSTKPSAFGSEDVAFIEALASQASIAITNARLIEELRGSRTELARRADAERSLREIASRLATYRDPHELLQHTVDAARRLLGADLGLLDLVDTTSGTIRWAYDAGMREPEVRRLLRDLVIPIGSGLFGSAVARRTVLATGDYLADDSFAHTPGADEVVRLIGCRSVVAAPLVGEADALGVLGLFSSREVAFSEGDMALLAAFADAAAVAITNANLIRELDRSRGELARRAETERTLREITARIASLRDQHDVLQQVVDEAKRLHRSDGAHLTLMSEDRTFLQPVVVAGGTTAADEEWLKAERFPIGGGLNGLAAALDTTVSTADYLEDPRIPHEADDQAVAARLGLRAMAVAPLRGSEGEVIGTLAISYEAPREIAGEDLQLLQGMADQAAIAVTNLRLYELLAESEARYRHLVQNSPDLVWSIDEEARFTFISDTCERLTGWRPEELLGQHFGALVHPSSTDVATQDWSAGLAATQELRGRLSLLHRDGHAIPAEFIALARVEDGRFAGANGSVRDMTERDRLERGLASSEARLREIIETTPDLLWETDAEGRFTFVSATLREMVGYEPDEVLGHHFDDVLHDDTREEAHARWADVLARPERVQPSRFLLRHRDGHPVPIENYSLGRMVDGRFVGAHGSARDVSERDRLERELRNQAAALAASEERAHLARELHDSVTQGLFSMTLLTRSIELLLERDPAAAAAKLTTLRELQRDALAETRALIFELRPSSLAEEGLIKALRTHTAAVQGRIGLPVVIEAEHVGRLPIEVEDALYRIAQEALHNVVKHANARQVRIDIRADEFGYPNARGGRRCRVR